MTSRPYHHGDLRRELLRRAAAMIDEVGPTHVSLRALARRAGVSHAAPAHHFGDKRGLLTAVAAEGFTLLADRLTAVLADTGELLEVGVAYVEFAVTHRAHFEVMFRPDLYDPTAPELLAARSQSTHALAAAVGTLPEAPSGTTGRTEELAAWSLVHGFANLWLTGAFPPDLGDDPASAARQVARVLFAPSTADHFH
ncbi:TetR/AcrR family transcriptional regulator [Natronosporangium hydrolyticum]|uniref:TetR/AcrR family transcriptional regulator n=1 Tax=Natronosporangium hydrolyticum TaxID=2811111 RepID=A0A895YH50_9ACTN|nr:TetR/AcrR family transcriptional regulator [Natronosporangium hydrolyticum]QSB13028.1 TetR/AcrR family transcriptional regulator [Natronosporangium hydrolyticum]